ncbi:beta-1,3-galactosyltransferase 5-like [Coccinella septempunctata]|uniref:beta-1,3-galactosyltransferase 5-like n=1 Tax=Coccinella septempunctata TaxID=41139 RepID=UPI001D06D094|nr:beta-1,3-galactosyltransferase 5-like [Coccinella septempunctata]XP_044765256.1 beta-1,3-galactosyltransferase 5-like [Coccinella septempunctata]XP_044765257.1 beta-1,3-galactosyltransferase 5-like [Coccinella septempunctata]XP_044765259.1 beta-1,3-galactosyltransferase 5-like [Coccinella septempunctata]XP_044765260.1 beta-1,3-galactosyltransferase 5-like [Coccinella septempunctata]
MGVPCLAQVRMLHLSLIILATISFLLYVCYMTTSQPSTTVSPMRLFENDLHIFNISLSQPDLGVKNLSAPFNKVSSEAPPPRQILTKSSLNSSNNEVDLSRGVAAEIIYESGHIDVNFQICPHQGSDLKLLIAVTSAPSHENARTAIRETWGNFAIRKDIAVAFMLGISSNETVNSNIKREQNLFGDIIQGKFIDTYDNLTLKTISMLEWVDKFCSKANYVLKTDDDMFINISRLLDFILKRTRETRAIYGRLAKKWKPIRNKKSKYYISPQQYKPAIFPDFTTGPAYLLPATLAKELYISALNHTYFKLEDVFITGIVANNIKIKRIHAPEFLNKRVKLTPCNVQKGISIHMIKGIEQYDLWKKVHDTTAKCK